MFFRVNLYLLNLEVFYYIIGMAIAENVLDAVYKSRKTIIVMSKNFLKSMWGQYELQQAHNKAIVKVHSYKCRCTLSEVTSDVSFYIPCTYNQNIFEKKKMIVSYFDCIYNDN